MSRKLYVWLLILSVITTLIVYNFRTNFSGNATLSILFILSMLFVASTHGIIAHSIRPEKKGDLIFYPILMGAVFGLILFLWVFVLIPVFYPEFIAK